MAAMAIDPIMIMGVTAIVGPTTSVLTLLINKGIQKRGADLSEFREFIQRLENDNTRLRKEIEEAWKWRTENLELRQKLAEKERESA